MGSGSIPSRRPRRGRFRDYLKTTLYHLVVDYQSRRRRTFLPLEDGGAGTRPRLGGGRVGPAVCSELARRDPGQSVDGTGRTGTGRRSALFQCAEVSCRASRSIFDRNGSRLDATNCGRSVPSPKPASASSCNAPAQFAGALIDEVERSLDQPTYHEVEQELIESDCCPTAVPLSTSAGKDPTRIDDLWAFMSAPEPGVTSRWRGWQSMRR